MQLQRVHQEGPLRALLLLALVACSETPRATAIALGAAHTCALDADGGVWCWGIDGAVEPKVVDGLPPITSLSAGQGHTCAVGQDGSAWCWGEGRRGQLGNGMLQSSSRPQSVAGVTRATAIAAGDLHTCALHDGDVVSCWGDNTTGQLGGSPTDTPQPVALQVTSGATAVSAGGIEGVGRSCVIKSGGVVWCWGRLEPQPRPTEITGASQIAVGVDHYCAVVAGSRLQCVDAFQDAALQELAETPFTAVSAGGLHTCALSDAGAVWCFGDDLDGQLGDGPANATDAAVRAIDGGATAVGAGSLHSCAVLSTGGIRCWGENNNGRLGIGTIGTNVDTPTDVIGFGE